MTKPLPKNPRPKTEVAKALLELLATAGPLARSDAATRLHISRKTIIDVLHELQSKEMIENFEEHSARGRLDSFWCVAGQRPVKPVIVSHFRGAEILEGFQMLARAQVQESRA